MLHYSCDVCKRPIDQRSTLRYVVKIEVFPAVDDQACGCEGEVDDDDHLEDVQELLERLDETTDTDEPDEASRSLRFDLCESCRQRFIKNPLGVKSGKKFGFSQN